jgi:hypothetical protein
MTERLNVVIVMARCRQSRQPFGLRFEEKQPGHWLADWAFPLKETSARREGYDRSEIRGAFGFDTGFPGCPSCRAHSIFRCGCGKVACWDGEQQVVTCPWCGNTARLEGTIDRLSMEHDR